AENNVGALWHSPGYRHEVVRLRLGHILDQRNVDRPDPTTLGQLGGEVAAPLIGSPLAKARRTRAAEEGEEFDQPVIPVVIARDRENARMRRDLPIRKGKRIRIDRLLFIVL